MKRTNAEELVLEYFKAVDDEDIGAILNTLTEDCIFSVETHSVKLFGHKEITGMFKRLWENHASVEHTNFHFVNDAVNNQVAVRFQVKNILLGGETVLKSNCNFFTLRDDIFSEVKVYMAGQNTLNKENP
ncbi:MAG: nuclear transport factor 2 family protein [Paracoccaceae bacterium]|jgi:ketosteroid isomerase-like protein|nr:nuclear transport factor 2 family protein [Rhodobacterales bacterium]